MNGFQGIKSLLKNNKTHISVAFGSREENLTYIKKEDHDPIQYYNETYGAGSISDIFVKGYAEYTGFTMDAMKEDKMKQFTSVVWKPWQQHIIDICETKPNGRKIYWC
ncbi:unnamed protein product [Phytomonas sp. Hart1]|nr:unnamed protein product [Phytomonas sp. Hart1]|eukprot:CCW72210.1 unnamed protein product [Phytomonas sp. isolate Hart1]